MDKSFKTRAERNVAKKEIKLLQTLLYCFLSLVIIVLICFTQFNRNVYTEESANSLMQDDKIVPTYIGEVIEYE